MKNPCACGCCPLQINWITGEPEGEHHPPCPFIRKRCRRPRIRHLAQDSMARRAPGVSPGDAAAVPPVTKVAA